MIGNVLVVAPHPDDEVLGCGGVIARSVARGDNVRVCIVTTGSRQVFTAESIDQVRTETVTAHSCLGITGTDFLDFPAPRLDTVARHEIADALAKIVADHKIDTVFIPHHGDIHYDHTVVHQAAIVACRPTTAANVTRIYAYETLSETEWASPSGHTWFIPNVYVDISPFLDQKIAAMRAYASQLRQPPNPRSIDAIIFHAKNRGYTVGQEAAEAFMLVREIRR